MLEMPHSDAVKVSKVEKYSSSKMKISWNNISNETGYQISQSTSSTKTNTVATYATET